jgi:fructooligosaccharide transport system substrate-binding protein
MDPPSAIHEGMTYNYLMYINAAGGRAVSEDGKTAAGYFDSEAVKKAMKLIADLHIQGLAPKEIISNGFQTGKVASVVTGTWMINSFNNSNGLEWGTAPMAGDVTYGAGMGSWEIGITSQSSMV